MNGGGDDGGTHTVPHLAVDGVVDSCVDGVLDVVVGGLVSLGDQQGHAVLGFGVGLLGIDPRRGQMDVGQPDFTGEGLDSDT